MQSFILKENVLSDNVLLVPDGKIFKGGFIAVIHEFKPVNEWNDKLTTKSFRTEKSLLSYLNKHYPDAYFELPN